MEELDHSPPIKGLRVDLITLTGVLGAFFVGVATTIAVMTYMTDVQRQQETNRTTLKVRLIQQIDTYFVEAERAQIRQRDETDPDIVFLINGVWQIRKKIFSDDLSWIANQIPNDVTSSEYESLATVFQDVKKFDAAYRYAVEAQNRSQSEKELFNAQGRIAEILFRPGPVQDIPKARSVYKAALDWSSTQIGDQALLDSALKYQKWGEAELKFGSKKDGFDLLSTALLQYEKLPNVKVAEKSAERVRAILQALESLRKETKKSKD